MLLPGGDILASPEANSCPPGSERLPRGSGQPRLSGTPRRRLLKRCSDEPSKERQRFMQQVYRNIN